MHEKPNHEITTAVEGVVSRYSFRNLIAIIVCAFGFGGWSAIVQYDLVKTRQKLAENDLEEKTRLMEWWTWRQKTDAEAAQAEWNIKHHNDRINNHEERLKMLEKKP